MARGASVEDVCIDQTHRSNRGSSERAQTLTLESASGSRTGEVSSTWFCHLPTKKAVHTYNPLVMTAYAKLSQAPAHGCDSLAH